MASPLLDFKKFKHIKSDGKTTTLQHKDGHTLTIAHNVLSKPHQEQLKALSKMGQEAQTSSQAQESQDQSQYGKTMMKAAGGEIKDAPEDTVRPDAGWGKVTVKSKAEGGEIKQENPKLEESHKQPCPHCGGGSVKMYADPTEPVSQDDTTPSLDLSGVGQNLQAAGFQPVGDSASTVDKFAASPEPTTPAAETTKQAETIKPSASVKEQDPTNQDMLQKSYQESLAGATGTAKAVGELGKAQADIQHQQAETQQKAIDTYKNSQDDLNTERKAHIQAINDGQIDPAKYWNTHSKIATGIGMILAGFNPTSNPNAAIGFLKQQMEQNLQAQAKNLESKQNLLTANLRQFGNLKDAADMTRVMQADYVSHKLGEAAATAQTPMAKAAALTAQGQINKEYQPLFMNLNMRRAAMNLANSPDQHSNGAIEHMISGLNSIGNPLGKQLGEAYVPGVGITRTLQPVPEATKNEILAMKTLDDKGKDVLNFIQQHKGVWNSEKDKGVVAQKIEEMKNFYNGSIKGGALTEGRLGWYDEQFSKHPLNAVAQFLGSTDKLKEMVDSNGHRLNMVLDQSALPPMKSAGTQQAPQYKTVNGIKYMRGPNGKAVPVK